jgi:hypothetical protein
MGLALGCDFAVLPLARNLPFDQQGKAAVCQRECPYFRYAESQSKDDGQRRSRRSQPPAPELL